jgi:flagellum-specific peptidoglycan hydrolase FlgJ
MNDFEKQVLSDLSELKTHMRWLVGNGQQGWIHELAQRVDRHEAILQHARGITASLAGFLAAATKAALAAAQTSRLLPGITVAQAALESAWGTSRLALEANNYFGIKAHSPHAWIELPTTEVRNGTAVRTPARFAVYGSMEECFADRDRLILTGTRYRAARECADRAEEFVRALAILWATDPSYAEKILRVYHGNGLSALDRCFEASAKQASPKEQPATNEQLQV